MTAGEQIITLDVDSHETVSLPLPSKTLAFMILRLFKITMHSSRIDRLTILGLASSSLISGPFLLIIIRFFFFFLS